MSFQTFFHLNMSRGQRKIEVIFNYEQIYWKNESISEDQKLDYRSLSKVFYNQSEVDLASRLASGHSHSHASSIAVVHKHLPWRPYLHLLVVFGHTGTVFMGLLYNLSILVFYNRENRSLF